MRRDVRKAIEAGRKITEKRDKLDISMSEIFELREMFTENIKKDSPEGALLDLIWDTYNMGLAVGMRNSRKKEVTV